MSVNKSGTKSFCKQIIKVKHSDGQTVDLACFSLKKLSELSHKSVTRLPYSIRVLLENQLRNIDQYKVFEEDVTKVLDWDAKKSDRPEIPHMPARVVMQDFTGVPAVVDLAAMRDAVKTQGGDPSKINPLVDFQFLRYVYYYVYRLMSDLICESQKMCVLHRIGV